MSSDADEVLFPEELDYDTAAHLLFQFCPDEIKGNAALKLNSPESFACYLYRNEGLYEQLKTERTSRVFSDSFWERFDRATPSFPNFHDKPPVVLRNIAQTLKKLVAGEVPKFIWSLDEGKKAILPDMAHVDFAYFSGKERYPLMLFHELGGFKYDNKLNNRIQSLFQKGKNTFLVNASATGKTRLLYEGLCQYWGLYFTAHADYVEALPLTKTLTRHFQDGEYDLLDYLPRKTALGFESLLATNEAIAERRFSAVLLCHLSIFRDFLAAALLQDGKITERQRRHWLQAQLVHTIFGGSDPFYALLHTFETEDQTTIDEQLIDVINEIQVLLPDCVKTEGFYIVIDEANVAIQEKWISGENDSGPYPALEYIILTWQKKLSALEGNFITFVVAGTEIPRDYFPPTDDRWAAWHWTSNTGDFNDQEVQRQYVTSFFPSQFAGQPESEALLRRIWDWCRPRHRLTSVLVQMLLTDNGVHPHSVLNHYIRHLTGYRTNEAEDFTKAEGSFSVRAIFGEIGALAEGRPLVQMSIHEVIMHYLITGHHPPSFTSERVAIVYSGAGQFADENMSQITLDQPGPLIATALWMSKTSYDRTKPRSLTSFKDFCFFTQGHWPSGDTYASGSYVAFYLAHVFQNAGGHLFSDIFTVSSPPAWLSVTRKFATYLVILRKGEDGILKEMVVKPSALEDDAPPLGYAASSADDVLAWLRHERSGAFCICPKDCDADLIFVLKRRGGYFWVILRTAGRGNASSLYPDNVFPDNTDRIQERKKRVWKVSETPITSDALDAEFERLAVENLFSRSESASDTLSTALSDAFAALPNSLAPDGQLSLLRVVGVFPSAPPFTSKKVDGSPVAVLNTSTFRDITEAIPATEIIEPLIMTLQDRRSQFADEAFTIVKSPSKKKAKRKQRPSAPGQAEAPAQASSLHHDEPSESLADAVETVPTEKVDAVSVETAPGEAVPLPEVAASPVREAKRTKTL